MNLTGIGAYQQAQNVGKMADRYGGPMGLAGKIIGLGTDEMEAGVPWWSWLLIGTMVGGATTFALRKKIERVTGDD